MSKTTNKFSPEVRQRAVRMVLDHEGDYPSRWSAAVSVAEKIGCAPSTLHEWVKKAEVDNSYDNALAETINGLYKAEVIHRCGPWRSFEAVEFATLEWVDWFNIRRRLQPIGNSPPVEAEEKYYAMQDHVPMAA